MISIKHACIHLHIGAAPAGLLLAGLLAPAAAGEPAAATVQAAPASRPAIGEYWEGQGGIYAGDFQGDDGTVYGLIVSTEEDVGSDTWGKDGDLSLSEWDGLANSKALPDSPAVKLATAYQRDGHSDFYLPARRELTFCAATVPSKFGTSGWYWTSTPRGTSFAWAVDFEHGYVGYYTRGSEFRVRPVRRFIY